MTQQENIDQGALTYPAILYV